MCELKQEVKGRTGRNIKKTMSSKYLGKFLAFFIYSFKLLWYNIIIY